MSIASIQLESYLIPRFYRILNDFGVTQIPPQSSYEVYRGSYEDAEIRIYHTGEVLYTEQPKIRQIIIHAIRKLNPSTTLPEGGERRRMSYVVMASSPLPAKKIEAKHNHLNVWLTTSQYYDLLNNLQNLTEVKMVATKNRFEESRIEFKGHQLSFHTNGKVLSDTGYSIFAPFVEQAIVSNLPFVEYDLVIGQDEVGNGEHIGPLVAASVGLTSDQMVRLQMAGIKDSKMIPKNMSSVMHQWIRQDSTLTSTWTVDPMEFNSMVLEEQYSMNEILTWAHTKAFYQLFERLNHLDKSFENILVIVDQYNKYEALTRIDMDPFVNIDLLYVPHGEQKSVSVAAASIVAKATRHRWIKYYEKVCGVSLKRKYLNTLRYHDDALKLLKLI